MEKKVPPMFDIPTYQQASTQLSIKQKVGQLLMPAAFINDSEEEVQRLEHLIREQYIGSLCFFHSRASAATNFEGAQEVIHNTQSYDRLKTLIQRYQKAAPLPLLIAIDAEWGLAMRIEDTPQYPYAITLGALQQEEHLVFQVGQAIASDCREIGIHWNLAPVVDINQNPKNPVIGYRSFGDDRQKVVNYARAYCQGMASLGTANALKHFPGHGDTHTDSHLNLPLIDKSKATLLENELYPYQALKAEFTDAIMVGHLAVPELSSGKHISASISKEIITGFLRGKMQWNGLIISDALNMHAIAGDFTEKGAVELAAFEAGNDVLCFTDNAEAGIESIAKKGNPEQIEASFQRLWQLKTKAFSFRKEVSAFNMVGYDALMKNLAEGSITMLWGNPNTIRDFREQGFQYLQIGNPAPFFIDDEAPGALHADQVLLSLTPRQAKPNHNFGLTPDEIEQIKTVINTKSTVLYCFGNPYVLPLIPWEKATAVVVVYQDFKAFQEVAKSHFLGELVAKGSLPITLENLGI
ncbi:MAG: glycoside hydrolase family 3 N-terminal domain-containing protein [Bacteroidota bacterium]